MLPRIAIWWPDYFNLFLSLICMIMANIANIIVKSGFTHEPPCLQKNYLEEKQVNLLIYAMWPLRSFVTFFEQDKGTAISIA